MTPNWLGSYDWNLTVSGGSATLVTNRGAVIRFAQNVSGGWDLLSPTYAKFRLDVVGGTWHVTNPQDRRIYVFDGVTWLLTQVPGHAYTHVHDIFQMKRPSETYAG